jgi:multidrug resistance efflux pump
MKLYTKGELKDARIFFDKNPPSFMTVYVVAVLIIIFFAIITAHFVKKPYVVKAQGVVAVNGTSYVASKGYGVINEIYAKSGDYVKKGDRILVISSGNEGVQATAIEEQIRDLEETIEVMDRYKQSLMKKENTLKENGKEMEYYSKINYYLDSVKRENYEINSLKDQMNEKVKEIDKLDKEINELQSQLEQLNLNKGNEISVDSELISNNEGKKGEIKGYLDAKKSEKKGLLNEVKQLEQQVKGPSSKSAELLNQLLSELGQSRNQASSKIIELTANLGASKEQDSVHTLIASQSGVLHYPNPLAKGMSIQQNQILGEIASEEEDFYIDAYIPAQDRSRVKVGNPVEVSIIGVNNHRFGSLSGSVKFIEPGTLKDESSKEKMIYYRTNVKLGATSLKSKSGEVVELMRSMPVEARIVYSEESYLEWLLNLLNLRST